MNRERLQQEKEDIELTLALLDDLEAEGAALEEWGKQITADPFYQKPLPRLKRRTMTRRETCANIRITRKHVMLFTLIIILSVSLLAGSVSGVFEDFYNQIWGTTSKDVTYRNSNGADPLAFDWTGHYYLPPPKRYSLKLVRHEGGTIIAIYESENSTFAFFQIEGYTGGFQDQEQVHSVSEVMVNHQEGYLFTEESISRICWGNNPHFIIEGNLSAGDALRLAESVTYADGGDNKEE